MRRMLAKLTVALLLAGGATVAVTVPAQAADPPTGDQLSGAVRNCTEQISNGKYGERSGRSRTVPVCATGNAVHWRSGMTIDCDGQRTTNCNKSTDPYFQPATSFPQSDGKPLIADKLPFVVVPQASSTWNHDRSGVPGGTVVAVVYKGKVVYAVVGDRGPKDAIGEGSYALAKALGINPNPAPVASRERWSTTSPFPVSPRSPSKTMPMRSARGCGQPPISWRVVRAASAFS